MLDGSTSLSRNLQHPDFVLSEIEPVGCWDPSRRPLFACHTGVFLGFMHFIPNWADEFESFVLIFRYSNMTKLPWCYTVVHGDDWKDLRPKYQEYFGFRSDALSAGETQSISLPQLYEESKGKRVIVSSSDNRPRWPAGSSH